MKLEDLKARLEERNEISFNYEFITDKQLGSNNSLELYYLKTKPDKAGKTIEIFLDHTSGNRGSLFNVYGLTPEGEAYAVYIRCFPERVEDILRDYFGIKRRVKQERLL